MSKHTNATVNWRRVAFWVGLFFLVYTWPTEGNQQPITLNIYPKVALATSQKRTTIRVEWRIPRHADNRRWAFSYEASNGDGGSSESSMDGENSYAVYPVCTRQNERPCYREVAPGTYHFVACVYRVTEGKVLTFCDRYTLEVGGGE